MYQEIFSEMLSIPQTKSLITFSRLQWMFILVKNSKLRYAYVQKHGPDLAKYLTMFLTLSNQWKYAST